MTGWIFLVLITFFLQDGVSIDNGDTGYIPSRSYSWEGHRPTSTAYGSTFMIMEGASTHFEQLSMKGVTINAGQQWQATVPQDQEWVILVKEGPMSMHLPNVKASINRGSVSLLTPGTSFGLTASADQATQCFLMQYKPRQIEADLINHKATPGIYDWDALEFRTSSKGGVRKYFEHPTRLLRRFEMHATTLNTGLQSHPPHTHRATEIILMLEGATEEQIEAQTFPGTDGTFYFLESDIEHTIRNTGSASATYIAFQFES